jgi:hypothetical protein
MAIGGSTFSDIGGGISDLFAVSADRSKAAGDIFEAQNYDLAAKYADQEAAFTAESTAIQRMQAERQTYRSTSQTRADIAGGGFAASGSGLDILASSASQGALQQAVIQRQGLITETGYEEQAQSYRNLESAADMAASAEKKAAVGAELGAGFKFAAAVGSLFTGGMDLSQLGGSDSGGGGEPMSLAPPKPQQFGPFPEPTGLRGVY